MRYVFIAAHSSQWPITIQCRVLGVTPSGYYAWKRRPNTRRRILEDRHAVIIREKRNLGQA